MKSRDKILATAFNLFIERGFGGVSMALIVKESGVSNGAVYHHFKSKREIIETIFFSLIDDVIKNVEKNIDQTLSIRAQFYSIWKLDIELALKDIDKKKFMNMFSNSEYSPNMWMDNAFEEFNILRNLYNRALEEEVIIPIDSRYFMIHFKSSIDGAIDYISRCPEKNTDKFLKDSFKMFWRSIVNI